MRFLMFDRITEFQKNRRICGIKLISGESGVLERVHGELVYPAALAVESLAQLGGWLLGASRDFAVLTVLAMVVNVRIYTPIFNGDELNLRVDAHPDYCGADSALASGEICRAGSRGQECVIRIAKLAYGVFPTAVPEHMKAQKRLFTALFQGSGE